MVTLRDIAQRCNVSIMTVSKVMHDAPDISAKTKAQVRAVAAQLGYVPDSIARGLRVRQTKTIGVILPNIVHPFFPRIVLGIEELVAEFGYRTVVAHSNENAEKEADKIRNLISHRVDGFIIAPATRFPDNFDAFNLIRSRNIPCVVIDRVHPKLEGFISLHSDDRQGAYVVTKHLIELGHRKIVFMLGPRGISPAEERFTGYRKALQESGIEYTDSLVFSAGFEIEDGLKAAAQMVDEKTDFTAVFAVNDLVAIGVAEFLMKQGLRIPQDVSLVGYSDLQIAQYYKVPLTTVSQPKHTLGRLAAEMLIGQLQNKKVESRKLPVELIIRESTRQIENFGNSM